ncbi:hypothetical protein LOZ53_000673 [Ophidiomyces ophidiicola]|uniref:Uncharacterized protein n=1 Tax=Ophidiomyces ophidiicola TaxID=1387563 RepID=A0ACB8V561_9EURO|nr:uncharacterized protein LOZ57_003085 [Ophidiomyces ophidiicola]KAI1923671.1 hypothetical protein LOZ64_000930 [Ophidiomyces ophidiicola]KAI1947933.1 hypothetical protein LOZ57_003085 [Ophidiomyces ophidiicola]KAI1956077.1 hypothetical protein LOZ62_000069 [Ophidiomyces ophidiicola]KAI1967760.1 hypothetical protein LOZ59_000575 [Ophidiomyces ophidiicola]KAI1975211.1 hypothetical protein LOZ56_000735 [Ophidiomyces ophidiicola]
MDCPSSKKAHIRLAGTDKSVLADVSSSQVASETNLWYLDFRLHASVAKEDSGPKGDIFSVELDAKSSLAESFLESCLNEITAGPNSPIIPIRFLLPSTNGSVVRSDFLERRLECCERVANVVSFLSPLQSVNAAPYQDVSVTTPATVLSKAIGAIRLHPHASFQALDADLVNRLSFSWLLPTPLSPRRIAWVQGREDIDCLERVLKAAVAMGIKLVVMDERGHWLQDFQSPWAHYREAFVEVDITPNDGFPQRVADAVKAYPKPIDGIVTISDVRLPGVAKACRILNLPSEDPDAYEVAGDKGRTRLLEVVGANESFVLESADGLEAHLANRSQQGLPPLCFPLVVKPVVGWSSDCVTKVRNETELVAAVRKASDRHADSAKRSTSVVVEPYVDGPEVDANFVLLDQEILFCDINDDFPSPADLREDGAKASFQETQNVIPSALSAVEIAAVQEQMRASVLRQGFKSGVFHCEARVRNSRARYTVQEGGLIDLKTTKPEITRPEDIEVYLHEVNARPAGYLESVAVALAYGVDYYATRMLLALGPDETARVRALSQPFRDGPQFHLSVMIIQQTQAGIMKTVDAVVEFLNKHPHIRPNVVDYYTRKKGGDILEGPDAASLWWIAFFSVVSRVSRRDLLEHVEYIESHFEYETDKGVVQIRSTKP